MRATISTNPSSLGIQTMVIAFSVMFFAVLGFMLVKYNHETFVVQTKVQPKAKSKAPTNKKIAGQHVAATKQPAKKKAVLLAAAVGAGGAALHKQAKQAQNPVQQTAVTTAQQQAVSAVPYDTTVPAVFFTNTNFTGRTDIVIPVGGVSLKLKIDYSNLANRPFKSIDVTKGYQITFYELPGYKGKKFVLTGSTSDFKPGNLKSISSWVAKSIATKGPHIRMYPETNSQSFITLRYGTFTVGPSKAAATLHIPYGQSVTLVNSSCKTITYTKNVKNFKIPAEAKWMIVSNGKTKVVIPPCVASAAKVATPPANKPAAPPPPANKPIAPPPPANKPIAPLPPANKPIAPLPPVNKPATAVPSTQKVTSMQPPLAAAPVVSVSSSTSAAPAAPPRPPPVVTPPPPPPPPHLLQSATVYLERPKVSSTKAPIAPPTLPIVFYPELQYTGAGSGADIGDYSSERPYSVKTLGSKSLSIQQGYAVTVFSKSLFQGTSLTLTQKIPDLIQYLLSQQMQEIASFKIRKIGVTFYENCSYQGKSVNVDKDVDLRTLNSLGFDSMQIRSITVSPGYTVNMYERTAFDPAKPPYTIQNDITCLTVDNPLTSYVNDKTTSVKIFPTSSKA